jgi:hypothetical protein
VLYYGINRFFLMQFIRNLTFSVALQMRLAAKNTERPEAGSWQEAAGVDGIIGDGTLFHQSQGSMDSAVGCGSFAASGRQNRHKEGEEGVS